MFFGKYPDVPELIKLLPEGWEADMEIIREPLDFYCQNIYGGYICERADHDRGYVHGEIKNPVLTDNSTPVTPKALYWGTKFLCERYGKPLMITENGMASLDWVALDGKVHDPQRIDYIQRYLMELNRAIADGADIIGYCHWSLTDNVEWCSGYTLRYGLIYIDYETLERIPKDSFYEYRRLIRQSGTQ